ncbi:DUF721 domain-containing protein [Teichococcus oryzae]|uniref:DUF721 domain-containing protein n=1 Tax=Teichococcus oryzae TaxID=1608942 RepID=A0A5B2TFK4_9PROT|nr:DciA family protein [Pseudoroseomonas oryzae]KAA2213247.1 DUF721 domain-containing protein [Pseudoroseomonas oryzae]
MQQEDEARRRASPAGETKGGAPKKEEDLPGWRPDRGLRPVGSLIPRLTKPVFRKRSPAAAHLMTDWPEIVGPALAAQSMPQKLVAGTLVLRCSGPVAMELQHLAPLLIGKINAMLGPGLVQRLRFVQGAVTPPAAAPRRPPRPVVPETVKAALEEVPDPELRAALARLAQGVYRRRG